MAVPTAKFEPSSIDLSLFPFIICLGLIGKVKLCPKMETFEEGGTF